MAGYRVLRVVSALLVVLALVFAIPAAPAQAQTAPRLTYVALGDSLGFGLWDLSGGGYVYRYRDMIAADTGTKVSVINLSVPGWTSSDLLNALRTRFLFRLSVATGTIVSWNIGGNDLLQARDAYLAGTCGGPQNTDCLDAALITFQGNWQSIVREIVKLRGGRPTIYRTMDLYYPFVAEDMASGDLAVLLPYLVKANQIIDNTITPFGGRVPVAQVYTAFNGPSETTPADPAWLLSFDGYHPNARGHAAMALQLRTLGYVPLR